MNFKKYKRCFAGTKRNKELRYLNVDRRGDIAIKSTFTDNYEYRDSHIT